MSTCNRYEIQVPKLADACGNRLKLFKYSLICHPVSHAPELDSTFKLLLLILKKAVSTIANTCRNDDKWIPRNKAPTTL